VAIGSAAPTTDLVERARTHGGRARRGATLVGAEPPPARALDTFESKLRVPAVRPGVVPRAGLVNRLRAERSVRLATVVAASGYGKTTLLAQWAARDARRFAWLSVDERDNDPLVLLRHLAAALSRIGIVDRGVIRTLARRRSSVWTAAAPKLAAAVSACRVPFVLVVDDADLIRPGESAEIVAAIAEHVPDGSTLVLSGRSTPSLPIARLRAGAGLLELGTDDLALGRREAQLLLQGAGLKLEDGASADLLARTEGWAAGLQLAVLARRASGPQLGDAAFTGADRYVAEYFQSEHLSRLTPERLALLRRTSVLDRLCGPLCDALLGSEGSAVELDAIARSNLFLVPSDREGRWYRYHPLFRDALRRELEKHEPKLVAVLNERAADWFEAHGDAESALDHAEAAGNAERSGRILTAIALPVFYAGRMATVEGWLERFAAHAIGDGYPSLVVLRGLIHALRGRVAEAERALDAALRGSVDGATPDGCASGRPWTALLRAALCGDGPARMEQDVDDALAELPADSPWLPIALVLHGVVATLRGEDGLADARFAAAADASERLNATDVRLLAIAERSLLAAASGDLLGAETLALDARKLLTSGPTREYATTAIVRAAAARPFLWRGRWDDARRELVAAERLAGSLTEALPWLAVQTRLAVAAAYVTLRDAAGASAQLDEITNVLAVRPHLGVLGDGVADLWAQVRGLPGDAEGRRSGLTGAELRLLPYLATHLSFREIAVSLYVSRNTIKTQAISAYRKLGVSSRSAAIERARGLGLVDVPAATANASPANDARRRCPAGDRS
jgi:LuxR family maltose regulon positive regulatory protein